MFVVAGVAGSGKSTVGAALAARLGCAFVDGDDLHPAANVAKMRAGRPLDDADRAAWLAAIGAWLDRRIAAGEDAVVACSALRRAHRDRLAAGRAGLCFVYLDAPPELIRTRLSHRAGHFFPADLMGSQFAALERPEADERAVIVPADRPIEEIVTRALAGPTPSRD